MGLFGTVLGVIGPALVFLAYGLIKTRQRLACEGLWAGFLAGLFIGLPLFFWPWLVGWLVHLDHNSQVAAKAGDAALAAIPQEVLKLCALLLVTRRFVRPGDTSGTILTSLSIAIGFALTQVACFTIHGYSYVVSIKGGSLAPFIGFGALGFWLGVFQVHMIYSLTMGALVAAADEGDDRDQPLISWRLAPALIIPVAMNGAHLFVLTVFGAHSPSNWGPRLLTFLTVGSIVVAILLCNYVLNRSDRGESTGSHGATAPALVGGFLVLFAMLLVGLPMIGFLLPVDESTVQRGVQDMAVFCILPLLFGLDLMWMAVGRMEPLR